MFPGTPLMTKEVVGLVDELYEMRLQSLLSVQDLVQAVVQALEVWYSISDHKICNKQAKQMILPLILFQHQGVLNNTYIFYNSDHGMYF